MIRVNLFLSPLAASLFLLSCLIFGVAWLRRSSRILHSRCRVVSRCLLSRRKSSWKIVVWFVFTQPISAPVGELVPIVREAACGVCLERQDVRYLRACSRCCARVGVLLSWDLGMLQIGTSAKITNITSMSHWRATRCALCC